MSTRARRPSASEQRYRQNIERSVRDYALKQQQLEATPRHQILPEVCEPFVLSVPYKNSIPHSVGKWIFVTDHRDGSALWWQIDQYKEADFRRYKGKNAAGLVYSVHIATGWLKAEWGIKGTSNFDRPAMRPDVLRLYTSIAEAMVATGDLVQAVTQCKPHWSNQTIQSQVHFCLNSKSFDAVARQAFLKAFQKHKINEDYLLQTRKDLIDMAAANQDFSTAERALRRLEEIYTAALESAEGPLQMGLDPVTGALPANLQSLIEAKKAALKAAEDAEVIDTLPAKPTDGRPS